jgi:branched-subunit amino acid transport protein
VSATWATLIFSSLFAFGLKYFGHSVPEKWLAHPRVQRINNLIPIVLLAALVAVNSFATKTKLIADHRIAGIIFAAIALKLKQSFLVVIVGAAVVSTVAYRLHF